MGNSSLTTYRHRAGPWAAAGTLLLGIVVAGCSGDDEIAPQGSDDAGDAAEGSPVDSKPAGDTAAEGGGDTAIDSGTDGADAAPEGPGMIGTAKEVASATSPFDATPDPTGAFIYFTALKGGSGGVFKVAVGGGAVTDVSVGGPLIAPFGIAISADGTTLFVADLAAATAKDMGGVFSVPAAGGTATLVTSTSDMEPRGLEVSGDQLYITGRGADGKVGVYKVPVAGGTPTAVATGAFSDPAGVAVGKTGDLYVLDTIGGRPGAILKVSGGAVTTMVGGLTTGFPAGIALAQDNSAVLASVRNPSTGTDMIARYPLAGGAPTFFTTGLDGFLEPSGMHRAMNADVYAWVDSSAGKVFVLSK